MEPNDVKPSDPVSVPELPASPTVSSEQAAPASVVTSSVPPAPVAKNNKKLFGKMGLVPAVVTAAVVLIGGSAAAYFGLVLPNQPENIWKTALNNTAKGYDKIVDLADEQKDVKGGKVKGIFKFESTELVVDGNIDGKYDKKNSNTNLDAGAAGMRFKFNVLTNIPEGATTPDIYVKAEGLDGLASLLGGGDPAAAEMLAEFNNQYYFIDHTLIEQYQKQAAAQADTSGLKDIKEEDVIDLLNKFGEVNKEFVFTTDSEKAIFTVKEEVGKETVDGRSVFHYKVGLDKDNLKKWNQAVCDKLSDHKVVKALSQGTSDEARRKQCEETSDYDSVNEDDTADVWVDMKTKLIRTVRITEKDDKAHFDFGLLYDGGDDYPFYFTFESDDEGDEGKVTVKIIVNTKTDAVTLNVDGNFKENDSDGKVAMNIVFEPSNETVEFTKPEGAKSLGDLIAPFMGSGLTDPSSFEQGFDEDAFSLE